MKITVLLADDHHLVRQGIRGLLETHSEIKVVGEAQDGWEALRLAKTLRPQVALLDYSMPLLDGAETAHEIVRDVAGTHVLMLSCHHDARFVERALNAGARGYLVKNSVIDEVFDAILAVARGETYVSSRLMDSRVPAGRDVHVGGATVRLTSRQMEVLQLIAEGKANKQIAAALSISIKTVEKHRQEVMNKLRIHNIAGLTRYAVCEGIIA